jgi:hypothetical protein
VTAVRLPLARAAAAGLLVAAGLFVPAGASPALAADDELSLVSSSSYALDPEAAVVRVTVDVTATNNKPNLVQETATGTRTTRYFYDAAVLVVHAEASSIKARAGRSALSVKVTPKEGYTIAEVRFRQDLYFQQSTKFTLTYDLAGGAPRSDSDIRVGSAFATFYAWAFGDRGDVRIVVPAGFEVETSGSTVAESVVDGVTTLTASGIGNVTDWYAVVVADRHDSLTRERLDLPGGEHLVIRAWPEDTEWQDRVTELLRIGLPVLVEKIGLQWPVEGEIEVAEVHTPLLEGYAGVFYTNKDLIEISEDLDELTIIHEASHAWFNSGLFVGRWINEGLADEYAARVLDEVSVGGLRPRALNPTSEGAVRLNEWSHPGRIADEETDARETFGYEASWTIIRQLAGEIGEEQMRAVFTAADARRTAYVGVGEPEAVTIQNDWRRFLDLLEETGGSKSAEDVFRRWVVTPEQEAVLDDRKAAREAYEALIAAGDGWLPGYAVRDPLGRWQFSRATEEIRAAGEILDVRDEIEAIAADLGVTPPTSLEAAYEGADADLEGVRALADGQLAVAETVRDTATAVTAERDVFTSLGLIGENPEAALDGAAGAFAAGDTDRAAGEAAAIRSLLDGADDAGRTRVLVGGGVALGVGGIGVAAVAMRRRRRAAVLGEPAAASPESSVETAPTGMESGNSSGDAGGAMPDEDGPYATLGGPRWVEPADQSAAEPPAQPAAEPAEQVPAQPDNPASAEGPAPSTAGPEGDEGDRT